MVTLVVSDVFQVSHDKFFTYLVKKYEIENAYYLSVYYRRLNNFLLKKNVFDTLDLSSTFGIFHLYELEVR